MDNIALSAGSFKNKLLQALNSKLVVNDISFVKDNRDGTPINSIILSEITNELTKPYVNGLDSSQKTKPRTAGFQIGINITNAKQFSDIQTKIRDLLINDDTNNYKDVVRYESNDKNKNDKIKITKQNVIKFVHTNNPKWKNFGQLPGDMGIFYPESFLDSRIYNINHAVGERLICIVCKINEKDNIFNKAYIVYCINNWGNQDSQNSSGEKRRKTRKTKKSMKSKKSKKSVKKNRKSRKSNKSNKSRKSLI